MNETRAREATLLQAFETVQPAAPSWTDDDRRWASRAAAQETPPPAPGNADAGAVGSGSVGSAPVGSEDAYIARRARHAMQRLAPREPAAAAWLARRLWRSRWVAWAGVAAFCAGLLADSIGSSQRINLLAPPLWGVVAWNLVVYFGLLGAVLAALLRRGPAAPGTVNRLAQRALRIGRALPGLASADGDVGDGAGGSIGGSVGIVVGTGAKALHVFAGLWSRRSARLATARAATLLHACAAALALGLIAGLYARGLVLDYRAAWESTFLDATSAHAVLGLLLAPASALTGIALPDAAGFEALRVAHASASMGAAVGARAGAGVMVATAAADSAGPWIHLLALTLALVVLLPRSLLALWSAGRTHHLAQRFALPLAEPYFAALLREQRGGVARVVALPYAATPAPQAVLGLHALLVSAGGDGIQLQVLATLAFGAEDDARAWPALPAASTLLVALFDLAATPEVENHGAFMRALAQRAPAGATVLALIDEAGFAARFKGDAARLEQRRSAWRDVLGRAGCVPAFADLQSGDAVSARRALRAALGGASAAASTPCAAVP